MCAAARAARLDEDRDEERHMADSGTEMVTQRFFGISRERVFEGLLSPSPEEQPLSVSGSLDRVEADVISVVDDRLIVGIADIEPLLGSSPFTATFSIELSDQPGGTRAELHLHAEAMSQGRVDAGGSEQSPTSAPDRRVEASALRELAAVLLAT
jgi:hypothetical protein